MNAREAGAVRGAVWLLLLEALPLLFMAVLALGSYLLLKQTLLPSPRPRAAPTHAPDYTMYDFVIRSFAADGSVQSTLRGRRLDHFPDDDTTDIADVRIESRDAHGQPTYARAERGRANADGSEVQLIGRARIWREPPPAQRGAAALAIEGEFFHVWTVDQRVRSDRPVRLVRGGTVIAADRLDYDHYHAVARLDGRVSAHIAARR
jgi:lipopolysaccharide export system protein LptC